MMTSVSCHDKMYLEDFILFVRFRHDVLASYHDENVLRGS